MFDRVNRSERKAITESKSKSHARLRKEVQFFPSETAVGDKFEAAEPNDDDDRSAILKSFDSCIP